MLTRFPRHGVCVVEAVMLAYLLRQLGESMLALFDRGIVPIEEITVAQRYGYVDEADRAATWRLKSLWNRDCGVVRRI